MRSEITLFLLLVLKCFLVSECDGNSCIEKALEKLCSNECNSSYNDNYYKNCSCIQQHRSNVTGSLPNEHKVIDTWWDERILSVPYVYLTRNIYVLNARIFATEMTLDVVKSKKVEASLDCYISDGQELNSRLTFISTEDYEEIRKFLWRRPTVIKRRLNIDLCYKYRVEISGHYTFNRTFSATKLETGVKIRHLPFGKNFTVSVQPIVGGISGNLSIHTFTTPSYEGFANHPMKCVIPKIGGFDAKPIRKVGNDYNVKVTWDKPKSKADSFLVKLKYGPYVRSHNVSGTRTEYTFQNVSILDDCNISVRAMFWAGNDEPKWKIFHVRKKPSWTTLSLSVDPQIALGSVLGLLSVMAVVYFARWYMKKNRYVRRVPLQEEAADIDADVDVKKSPSEVERRVY